MPGEKDRATVKTDPRRSQAAVRRAGRDELAHCNRPPGAQPRRALTRAGLRLRGKLAVSGSTDPDPCSDLELLGCR
ncbi:unnamed protein product [marine sediment metagenome]|uniref:Uncharacterized protein n=1 Tax=marine sediment metagenome TaxID=412755 RepID=X1STN7_9ZZZZ